MATVMEARHGILEAIYHRRAVRAYTAEQPAEDDVRELLNAAVQAPTAMHAEPWAFVVVQDRPLLLRLSDRAKQMLLEELETGSDLAADVPTKNRLLAMLGDPKYNIFYDAGTLIVICRRPDGRYAEADCWLAAENLMLAAWARQLGTCCIGFAVPVLNAPDVKQALGIPSDVAAVVPIIVGHPRGGTETVPRKPPQILRWVR